MNLIDIIVRFFFMYIGDYLELFLCIFVFVLLYIVGIDGL